MDADSFWLRPDLSLGHSWTRSMALVLLLSTRAHFSERQRSVSLITVQILFLFFGQAYLPAPSRKKNNSLEEICGIGLFGNDAVCQRALLSVTCLTLLDYLLSPWGAEGSSPETPVSAGRCHRTEITGGGSNKTAIVKQTTTKRTHREKVELVQNLPRLLQK